MLRVIAEGVLQVGLGRFFGTVQVATAHLRPRDPQFAGSAERQPIELFVNDIKFQVVQRFSDGNIQFIILHPVVGGEDGTLRRTIAVVHLVVSRRVEGGQLLATHCEATQRMVVHIRGKLVAHLRGDE